VVRPAADGGWLGRVIERATHLAAGAAGRALAWGLGTVARLRRGKPLHPRGDISRAVLEVTDPVPGAGPFLGSRGTYVGLGRRATAMGLPAPLPDIDGLALRLVVDERDADLLLASTGTGRWTQHLLAPHRSGALVPLTTLFPFETGAGRVVLGLFPTTDDADDADGRGPAYDVRASISSGPWRPVGHLTLEPMPAEDQPALRFDPVRNTPPGLTTHPVIVRLRDPAYVAARRRS
jgi:hypothetical protein